MHNRKEHRIVKKRFEENPGPTNSVSRLSAGKMKLRCHSAGIQLLTVQEKSSYFVNFAYIVEGLYNSKVVLSTKTEL